MYEEQPATSHFVCLIVGLTFSVNVARSRWLVRSCTNHRSRERLRFYNKPPQSTHQMTRQNLNGANQSAA